MTVCPPAFSINIFLNTFKMTGPKGNSQFCFLRMPMETLRFEGSKLNCFPRDQSLSDLLYSWKFKKPCCNGGRRSTFVGNKGLLPSDVIDFVVLPAQRFWQETVSLSPVMWPQSNQGVCMMLGKNFQPKNKNYCFIFPIAFENNKSCKISMPNWVCYGGFQNSQLGHMLPRLPLMQCNHNKASGISKRLKDYSVTCDDGQSVILFFIILSSSLPV